MLPIRSLFAFIIPFHQGIGTDIGLTLGSSWSFQIEMQIVEIRFLLQIQLLDQMMIDSLYVFSLLTILIIPRTCRFLLPLGTLLEERLVGVIQFKHSQMKRKLLCYQSKTWKTKRSLRFHWETKEKWKIKSVGNVGNVGTMITILLHLQTHLLNQKKLGRNLLSSQRESIHHTLLLSLHREHGCLQRLLKDRFWHIHSCQMV
ncbi:hypothetical protein DFH28DRAFT_954866 [Melampsora americana]|nr:hypothetical protein DFH28DRAFT_954866 [Melampsora americana]